MSKAFLEFVLEFHTRNTIGEQSMKLPGIVLIISVLSLPCKAITLQELADVFEGMESSIVDVAVEYEWFDDRQETKEDVRGSGKLFRVGKDVCSFATARPFTELQLYSWKGELGAEQGETFFTDNRTAYNGDRYKRVVIGGLNVQQPQGFITKRTDMLQKWHLTPMGFTILRDDIREGLLSELLRGHPEVLRLVPDIRQVGDFRTIELDFITAAGAVPAGAVHRKMFLSVDHGYAPVRWQWLAVTDGTVQAEVDVLALKEISPGMWFPVKGTTGHVNDPTRNIYEAKEVKLNQNLSKEHFDVEFPPGTAVIDEIANVQYTYQPTRAQLDTRLEEDEGLATTITAHSRKTPNSTDASTSKGPAEMDPNATDRPSHRTRIGGSSGTLAIFVTIVIVAAGTTVWYRTRKHR
jgi:hypothetical protein